MSFERPDVGRSPVAGPFRRAAAGSWAHDIPLELLGFGVQKKIGHVWALEFRSRTCVTPGNSNAPAIGMRKLKQTVPNLMSSLFHVVVA